MQRKRQIFIYVAFSLIIAVTLGFLTAGALQVRATPAAGSMPAGP